MRVRRGTRRVRRGTRKKRKKGPFSGDPEGQSSARNSLLTQATAEWEPVLLSLPKEKTYIEAMLLNDPTVPGLFSYIYVPAKNHTLEIYYGDILQILLINLFAFLENF